MKDSSKKQLKVKPKDQLFKSNDEIKADIVVDDTGKELVTRKEDKRNNKQVTPINDAPDIKLWLDNIEHTRGSLARMIRMVGHNEYPVDKAGKMCYLMQTLLQAFKTESDLTLYTEVLEIKKMLKERKKSDV